jgi:hypothetical protein
MSHGVLAICVPLLQAARGGEASLLGADGLDGPEAFLSVGSQLELAPRADIDLADDEETGEAAAGQLQSLSLATYATGFAAACRAAKKLPCPSCHSAAA